MLDKLKILELRQWLNSQPAWQWLKGPDISTLAFLQQFGFSNQAINHFFVPFFGGIFLDTQLNTSALLFKYYFALLSQGDIGVPKGGMQRIPEQLAQGLTVHLSTPVLKLSPNTTSNGYQLLTPQGTVSAEQVIIATDPFNAQRLCGNDVPKSVRQAYYFYFVPQIL